MSKEKDYSIKSLIRDACHTYDEEIEHYNDEDDAVHEIADNAIPIYYWDIAQYAGYNHWLMTEIPDINPNANAHDQIQSNLYEAICEGLYEHINEKETEDE